MRVIDFKDAKCRHCYKCVRYCAVKAISVKDEQAHIMLDHCINCGRCLEVCPQNAKTFASDMERVKGYLRQGIKTIISIAPSYAGVLEFDKPGQVVDALLKLGFAEVRETAEGAALVTNEYKKIIRENKMPNIITTCCPSVNDLIEKYYPECVPLMAPVVSPMIAHGRYIKKIYGDDVKVVFLGPCIAKKQEAIGDERVFGAIDAILTFEELAIWLEEAGIDIYQCEEKAMGNPDPRINRLYPVSGGIVQSVVTEEEADTYHKVYVDGLENCMEMLECLKKGELTHCFIEANVCEGGCAKGPASARWNTSYVKAKVKIANIVAHKAMEKLPDMNTQELEKKFRDNRLSDRIPSEQEIREILRSTGKYAPEDELNCGACGYPTCRDKAIAVSQGKAELSMCMPYALNQAESMSNVVMDVTPNMIFVIGSDLKILDCNKKAQELLGVGREEAVQRYIFEFIETEDIEETLRTKEPIIHKKIRLEHGRMTAEETIVYIENLDSVLVTFQDVTREEKMKEQHYHLKVETVEMAQKVIEKQMMVAQEIAGLLGETTAETKVTLTKLRDSILEEED
ncbi:MULTISPECIES: [Fe-Fe] hydrogenase large subunit C-terminal domain-containing protein [Lachnospiraceae]|jgi:PAS domain S-box-containing protein|uniref:PAS domain-containing protein n=1 Tax=Faecalicatena acetigenes TaxID=2981790 RepID=A0ABT2T8H3_9FIRM|nr:MULTISPECIES: [Fe-Fe] hydrogenase large subunit C-terminal domain-containing protein [Lachnospiraceae]MCU6746569.1 PAS domain-containing protein [Faecalicatena acetigenes]RGT73557.1 PAS domain-containing protein [Ruminococcus sp. AF18-22]SCH25168.1 Periplasmic [Fe] hydrogenase large subunit [uncultured Clostridium sp.]